jgi:16S rRNA (uracil1498-N3)-methyltransferase
MHYFYVSEKISGCSVSISDAEQIHHLKNVLRLKIGDEVFVFDGDGTQYSGQIAGIERERAVLRITARKEKKPSTFKLTIACALPKKAKMDEIIDKLTQLGVDTIIPLMTERVVVRPNEKDDHLYKRWQKIALNASEQSQRGRLPVIHKVKDFKELMEESNQYSLKLIPTLEGERQTIQTAVSAHSMANILVLIGPEGDFSFQEVQQARECGFIPVSLGENVLRVDTAAIAVASYLKLALCEKGD